MPFLRFSDMLRVAPQLALLRADRSVYSTVSRFVKDEHLRQALSFHTLLVGGNPFETSAIYTLIHYLERKWGVFFPRGGTSSLVHAMVRLFEELGGKLSLSTPVLRIQVLRDDGSAVRETRRLESLDWSMSLFVLYFGTNRSYRDKVAHHTVLFGPRYRGLLQDIFHGSTLPNAWRNRQSDGDIASKIDRLAPRATSRFTISFWP